jgi:hypothetical protein
MPPRGKDRYRARLLKRAARTARAVADRDLATAPPGWYPTAGQT